MAHRELDSFEEKDRKREQKHREQIRRYQQSPKFKEYTTNRYLDKVKTDYRKKTEKYLTTFERKTSLMISNDVEIFEMIINAENTKEVKKIYDNLLKLIVVVI